MTEQLEMAVPAKTRRAQCGRCQRPLAYCLCAWIPKLRSAVSIQIIQHPDEAKHALNTARLAALGLEGAQLHVGEEFPLITQKAGRYLLFPGPEAQCVTQVSPSEVQELIVPDGTWRKARKILHLNPELAALPRLMLPEGQAASRYRLRKAPSAEAVSTLEAIVRSLNTLENTTRFDALLKPFEVLIEQQIQAMGPEVFLKNHV